jgi:lipopolysaccharide export system permease protein
MINRLDRYLIREVMTPFWMTLGIAALLLILERMLRLFDFVVNQGGPVGVVFRMLGTLIPHYLGLALPIGLFLGILLAFRKMSLNRELVALQATGTGLTRMMRPVMLVCLVMLGFNVVLMGFIQPYAAYTYGNLEFDLRSGALGASVKVGEYVDIGDGMILRVEESRNNGAELLGIFLERTGASGRLITVTAEKGSFFSTNNQQTVILRLQNGRLVDLTDPSDRPRAMTFDSQDITIDLPNFKAFRARGSEYLEWTIDELWDRMNNPAIAPEQRNRARASFHMLLVQTMGFLLLPLLAIPLGITSHRAPKATGIVVGLALVILLHELFEVCEFLVAQGEFGPFETFWALFGLYAVFSLWLFRLKSRSVTANPLGFVDKIITVISNALNRTMRNAST